MEGLSRSSVYSQSRNSLYSGPATLRDFCPIFPISLFHISSSAKFEQTSGLVGNWAVNLSWKMQVSWEIIINLSTYLQKMISWSKSHRWRAEKKRRERRRHSKIRKGHELKEKSLAWKLLSAEGYYCLIHALLIKYNSSIQIFENIFVLIFL